MAKRSIKRTAGATFDPADAFVYFLATKPDKQHVQAPHAYQLLAVSTLGGEGTQRWELLQTHFAAGRRVLLDSGIFELSTAHAKAHRLRMDQALALAPEEIDHFDDLFRLYCTVIDRFGAQSWGYIELDQGGRDNKIRTRAKLEALGYRPIPVYHPLNDGWDYFDELASQYDRICMGNIVQADAETRKRLLATIWERHRRYPDLWIHLLGLTPSQWLYAYPINSADSSTWSAGFRWPTLNWADSAGKRLGSMPDGYFYAMDVAPDAPGGCNGAAKVMGYSAAMLNENWRAAVRRLGALDAPVYPPLSATEDLHHG